LPEGVKVAVVPLYVTAPVTPLLKVKVLVATDVAAIASLKVAVTAAFTATPVALMVGLVNITVGGVMSVGVLEVAPPPPPHDANIPPSNNAVTRRLTAGNMRVSFMMNMHLLRDK